MAKATISKDGVERLTIRVDFRLTSEEIALLVIDTSKEPGELENLKPKDIVKILRDKLYHTMWGRCTKIADNLIWDEVKSHYAAIKGHLKALQFSDSGIKETEEELRSHSS